MLQHFLGELTCTILSFIDPRFSSSRNIMYEKVACGILIVEIFTVTEFLELRSQNNRRELQGE